MKSLLLAFTVSVLTINAFASGQLDCAKIPPAGAHLVPMLAPKKARAYLSKGTLTPELASLKASVGEKAVKRALEMGLAMQAIGNEALVYDVDALAEASKDATIRALSMQIAAQGKSPSGTAYYSVAQASSGIRVVGRLMLDGRKEEASRFLSLVYQALADSIHEDVNDAAAHKILTLRLKMSSTGKFATPSKSRAFCEGLN